MQPTNNNDDAGQEIYLWARRRGVPHPLGLAANPALLRRFGMTLRRRWYRESRCLDNIPDHNQPIARSPEPVEAAIRAETRQALVDAINRCMSGGCREVFHLLCDGHSIPEIVVRTGMSTQQVYNYINYGKRLLRQDAKLLASLN